jgi:hypothetical protein
VGVSRGELKGLVWLYFLFGKEGMCCFLGSVSGAELMCESCGGSVWQIEVMMSSGCYILTARSMTQEDTPPTHVREVTNSEDYLKFDITSRLASQIVRCTSVELRW